MAEPAETYIDQIQIASASPGFDVGEIGNYKINLSQLQALTRMVGDQSPEKFIEGFARRQAELDRFGKETEALADGMALNGEGRAAPNQARDPALIPDATDTSSNIIKGDLIITDLDHVGQVETQLKFLRQQFPRGFERQFEQAEQKITDAKKLAAEQKETLAAMLSTVSLGGLAAAPVQSAVSVAVEPDPEPKKYAVVKEGLPAAPYDTGVDEIGKKTSVVEHSEIAHANLKSNPELDKLLDTHGVDRTPQFAWNDHKKGAPDSPLVFNGQQRTGLGAGLGIGS